MDQAVIDKCQAILEDRRAELNEGGVDFDDQDQTLEEEVGELTTFDNHPGDMGTELYEREKDQALNEHQGSELNEIDHALVKIEEGTYHLCEKCGKEINEDRLLAMPATRFCIDHAE
ncbi:TraR/DksA C4-type zinc finger protein [Gracilibacillus caseinilyticus]|uniref:TraR/DksA C4-type zinc finger protein n=1 Tax=Gracilibacillus caseinilyticus TaxID=2932256 RepID=A0ABY4F3V8_9BACI|nr:TraR/DksA C4-type zinc finger protein [Gracilibacillus caseinilyticus]UOQ49151.1 TraR/DksA C4-type zinc finger protein [Gracilibacillus caseinilyticus]